MIDAVLHGLLASTLASSVAVLLVALLRKSVRRFAGPQSAYLLWLLVPITTLAVFLPVVPATLAVPAVMSGAHAVINYVETLSARQQQGAHWNWMAVVWLAGFGVTATLSVARQIRFVRRLRNGTRDTDGILYSEYVSGPMLVGVVSKRIVVPADFAVRYTEEQRSLMLAHEEAHLSRGDEYVIALAAIWLCLFWFNPLMYWALGRLHFDQELACDALVVLGRPAVRKLYARVLLEAQLPQGPHWGKPIGCHWTSAHPLRERIAMLKNAPPHRIRRATGIAIALVLPLLGVVCVEAVANTALAQEASEATGDRLAKRISISVTDVDIGTILQTISRTANMNIVADPAVTLSQRISLHFVDIDVRSCLELVTKVAGATYRDTNGIIYIERPVER